MGRSNRSQIKTNGLEARTESHQSDSPLIPFNSLDKIKASGLLDWYKDETSKEADHRRELEKKEQRKKFLLMLLVIIVSFVVSLSLFFLAYQLSNKILDKYWVIAVLIGGGLFSIGYIIQSLKE